MKITLLQRLFRRSKPVTQPVLTPLLWREQHIHEDIWAEVVAHPEMCEQDVSPRLTARLTRLIAIPTLPLSTVDHDAPTVHANATYWFYEDATECAHIGTDPNATVPVVAR